jgi:cysteine desulfurase
LLGCSAGEIVFTSGATEANNLALHTVVASGRRLVVSAVEHPAVLETACALDPQSASIGVDRNGTVDLHELDRVLAQHPPGSCAVSVMSANNETGVHNDLDAIRTITRRHDALLHTDATQSVGRVPISVTALDLDLLSLSAHKFGGPQGVGALFIRRDARLQQSPILHGGGQERGWRSGTHNVAGICGLGAACAAADSAMNTELEQVRRRRDQLEHALSDTVPDIDIIGVDIRRLPNVSAVTFRGAPADAVLAAMPDIAASHGSACSRGTPEPSHVLLAMGRSPDEAEQTIRFSLGHATTDSDITAAAPRIADAVHRVRRTLNALDASLTLQGATTR